MVSTSSDKQHGLKKAVQHLILPGVGDLGSGERSRSREEVVLTFVLECTTNI